MTCDDLGTDEVDGLYKGRGRLVLFEQRTDQERYLIGQNSRYNYTTPGTTEHTKLNHTESTSYSLLVFRRKVQSVTRPITAELFQRRHKKSLEKRIASDLQSRHHKKDSSITFITTFRLSCPIA